MNGEQVGESDMKCARRLVDQMTAFAKMKPHGAVVGMFEPSL
jgi:hypothetical protein